MITGITPNRAPEPEEAPTPGGLNGPVPRPILLATDGSKEAGMAAKVAADMALRGGAPLHVAHAWTEVAGVNYLPSPTEAIETGDEAAAVMDTELRRACRAGLASVEGHLKRGCPDAVVAALAESINAGIIVVGSRGNGPLKRVLLGSVAETLVRSAPCPVLVCRGGALYWPGTHVVAGDDLSDDALRAAIWAGRLSRALELPLRLTHVRPPGKARRQLDGLSGARRLLHERAQQVYLATGVWPIPDVVLGAPASALRDAAYADGRAGIIVVGRRGHRALSRLVLGRVSMDVLRAAMGPVMVVPAGSSQ